MLHRLLHKSVVQLVKATSDSCVSIRGKGAIRYVRRRIPASLRLAYPAGQTEIVRSLGTADHREAKRRAILELARIEAEFKQRRAQLDLTRASEDSTRVTRTYERAASEHRCVLVRPGPAQR